MLCYFMLARVLINTNFAQMSSFCDEDASGSDKDDNEEEMEEEVDQNGDVVGLIDDGP